MQIFEYKIKKGDTLESIAKEYERSIKELIDFHNSKSLPTRQIYNDYIPIHIDVIMIDNLYIKSQPLKNILTYRLKSENEYFNFNKVVHSTNNEVELCIEKLNGNKFFITQISKQIKCKSPNYDNLLILLSLLDRPFENIILSTDDLGNIISIDNQDEIKNEWELVKSELNGATEDKDLLYNLFADENKVYTKSLEHIKANVQYNLFFPGKFNIKDSSKIKDGSTANLYSSLFSGTKIMIKFKNRILHEEKDFFVIENKAFLDKKNELVLKDLYDVTYREMLGNNFNYDFKLSSKYEIRKGMIETCETNFIETINDTMVSKSRYIIEKI